MAFTNGLYVHVVDEELTSDVEISSHPVEEGIDFSDTMKRNPSILSISGKIVDYPLPVMDGVYVRAYTILECLKADKDAGRLITYQGRNICYNYQITSFSTTHPNTNTGGADFTMELQECRIAGNAYIETTPELVTDSTLNDGGTQQIEKAETTEVYYAVKAGDCVWNLVEASGAPYKSLSRPAIDGQEYSACDWVMQMNPGAFSRSGDFRTLQIGANLLMGYRT